MIHFPSELQRLYVLESSRYARLIGISQIQRLDAISDYPVVNVRCTWANKDLDRGPRRSGDGHKMPSPELIKLFYGSEYR
jgi:hypothetical protein